MELIKKEELEIGCAYEVDARNFTVGIWTGETFAGLRYKLGNRFIDYEYHWDDDPAHGTAIPIRKLE